MLPGFTAEQTVGASHGTHHAAVAGGSALSPVVPQAMNLGRAHARCGARCLGEYIGGGFQCAAGIRSELDCSLLGTRYDRCTGICDLLYT